MWGVCSGDYGPNMTIEKLKDFHRGRLLVLANAGADLLALETIPCKLETQVSFQLSCSRGVLFSGFGRKQA
jgi:homocysteine S-methyltransferase